MSHHDIYNKAEEAEFLEQDEISEEQLIFDSQDSNASIPMDDEEDEDPVNVSENDDEREQGEEQNIVELIDDSIQGFFAHQNSVYSLDIHPIDQHLIASGGGDDKSYLWRADTGEQLYTLSGHTDSVTSVLFSNDGRYVASGGMDGQVRVWKVDTGELIKSLEGPDEVMWLNWHPKGNLLIAGSNDSTIWMWQIPKGNVMNVFAGHSASVTAGQFTPDGKKIVTGSNDSSLIVWDPKTAGALIRISGDDARFHSGGITSLAINQDSSLVITGSTDNSARLININNGTILGSFENHTESVETVGFSNLLPLAATGSVDNSLNIWDVTTMRLRQTCNHNDAIIKLKWHATTPLITTCSGDRTIRVWDARTGACERSYYGHQDSILDFAITGLAGSFSHHVLVFYKLPASYDYQIEHCSGVSIARIMGTTKTFSPIRLPCTTKLLDQQSQVNWVMFPVRSDIQWINVYQMKQIKSHCPSTDVISTLCTQTFGRRFFLKKRNHENRPATDKKGKGKRTNKGKAIAIVKDVKRSQNLKWELKGKRSGRQKDLHITAHMFKEVTGYKMSTDTTSDDRISQVASNSYSVTTSEKNENNKKTEAKVAGNLISNPKINFSVVRPPQPVQLGTDSYEDIVQNLEVSNFQNSEAHISDNPGALGSTAVSQPLVGSKALSQPSIISNDSSEGDKKKRKRSRWDQAGTSSKTPLTSTPLVQTSSTLGVSIGAASFASLSSSSASSPASSIRSLSTPATSVRSASPQVYTADKRQFIKFSDTYKPGMVRVGSKWVYPEDEITDGGTWEHKKRAEEMKRTADQAALLTAQAEAKRAHHIADFLPKEELHKFESKVKAVKTGDASPDYEDYASNKLDQSNIGFKMLMKQGWQAGSGLGKSGDGIAAPINKADSRPTNAGLGQTKPDGVEEDDDEFEIYRKRMMLAYRFRPNPLVRAMLCPFFVAFAILLRLEDSFKSFEKQFSTTILNIGSILFADGLFFACWWCTTNVLPFLEQSSSTILLKTGSISSLGVITVAYPYHQHWLLKGR
ncbi:hypothetical protein G9A89_023992 [Geosiphon pyriformis]|nr:hypothetical protein G9A89_023992 [Geosiphon pyriformis]